MTTEKITLGRRTFIKSSVLAGGGLMLGFSWMAKGKSLPDMPSELAQMNAYLKIAENGDITIMAPNPEVGTDVRTSLPMLVAEELDADWDKVFVEQAPFNPEKYGNQFTGGSMAILSRWEALRKTGATARQMLREAAAKAWNVPVSEITTRESVLYHKPSGKSAGYGEMASAASKIRVPENVELKQPKDFTIIGTSRPNKEAVKIVTGKAPYSSDTYRNGMLIAMVAMPPAFGMKLKSFDATEALAMPGIKDVFSFTTLNNDFKRSWVDVETFPEMIAIVGESTWQVMKAREKLKAEWEPFSSYEYLVAGWGGDQKVTVPAGLESTAEHKIKMKEAAAKPAKVVRKNGNPEEAFKSAAKVLERTYTSPFFTHVPMEPIVCFAHVTDEQAEIAGPIQSPNNTRQTLATMLGLPVEKVHLELTRMGGAFGRHFYTNSALESAVISKRVKAPVKLVFTREDSIHFGVFKPTYLAVYRAAIDNKNKVTALQVIAGGVPESPLNANAFPAGAIDNYLAEEFAVPSNVTVGAFRAPSVNFMASAEQSFLDELAETVGKDPIEFRLELLDRAIAHPVGEHNDYDAVRYKKVIEEIRDKSGWGKDKGKKRGMAAYFCHNSYVAHVFDMVMKNGEPRVENACSVVDCGTVVNPSAAINMVQGNVVDAVGHAMYGELTLEKGVVQQDNFDSYRLIRMNEAPKKIEVHFVKSEIAPTGLGEPPYPPAFAAVANALYQLTGKRHYHQPFIKNNFD